MYSSVVVLLVAALCFQGSAAASNADTIHDKYLKSLTQYLGTLPNAMVTEWPAFSAHVLRRTDLAYGLNNLGSQLKNTYQFGSCVEQFRAVYTDLKNQAISAFQKCTSSMSPSIDQAEISNAIDQLKSLDNRIQQLAHSCDNVNKWGKYGCQMGVKGKLLSIYLDARLQQVMTVYYNALDRMRDKGQELIDCVSQATPDMPDQIHAYTQQLYDCRNIK